MEAVDHRGTAFGLDNGHLGYLIDKAHIIEFFEASPDSNRPHPATHCLDIPIRRGPAAPPVGAQLFGDFKSHGFHSFSGGNGLNALIQEKFAMLSKLGGYLLGCVIITGDFYDFCTVKSDLSHLFMRNITVQKSP